MSESITKAWSFNENRNLEIKVSLMMNASCEVYTRFLVTWLVAVFELELGKKEKKIVPSCRLFDIEWTEKHVCAATNTTNPLASERTRGEEKPVVFGKVYRLYRLKGKVNGCSEGSLACFYVFEQNWAQSWLCCEMEMLKMCSWRSL